MNKYNFLSLVLFFIFSTSIAQNREIPVDTIVVTKNGNENFTDFLPSELDDLESLVLEKGILQTLPENKMKWRR